jgi:hypothetical protein
MDLSIQNRSRCIIDHFSSQDGHRNGDQDFFGVDRGVISEGNVASLTKEIQFVADSSGSHSTVGRYVISSVGIRNNFRNSSASGIVSKVDLAAAHYSIARGRLQAALKVHSATSSFAERAGDGRTVGIRRISRSYIGITNGRGTGDAQSSDV